jgi:hypothetical protein
MNELVADRLFASDGMGRRIFGTRETRQSGAFYGYSLTTIAIGIGWLLRDRNLLTPEDGLGYWLGIVGGTILLVLLMYPLRKRFRSLQYLGSTKQWFQWHMILGVLGPLLVLYHSNFRLGSFNSQVALYCMLLVAGSGLIGKYIYAHVHRGLYGRKNTLGELRAELSESLEKSRGLATLLPGLAARLNALAAEVQGDSITGSMSMRASVVWSVRQYFVWGSLRMTAYRELKNRATASPAIAKDLRKLNKVSAKYIRTFIRQTGRVAQFTLFERLFSLWHILHMPFFFMMIISALFHVLAVHMY